MDTRNMSRKRQVVRSLSILLAVLCFLFIIFSVELLRIWKGVGYSTDLDDALRSDIRVVEIRPYNGDPRMIIDNTGTIEQLKRWLHDTREDSPVRSAPPPLKYELIFVLVDGSAVELFISEFDPPNVFTNMRVSFGHHWRSGSAAEFAKIIDQGHNK
jgi:hypothetical protein